MADFVWPEDSGTGSSEDDYADAANFAAHRHASPLTDYVESGMNITVDWANDQFDVSSGMAFISDGSASLTQKTEKRDHGVTYAVGINSRNGLSLANTSGMNDVIVTCDPNNGPDNVSVAAIDPGVVYGDPHIIIAKLDASSNEKEAMNRRPHLNFGGGEVQNFVYAENFATVQAAIDHAEDSSNPYYNGYVYVPPGVYSENLTLHRRTKLVGNSTMCNNYSEGDTVFTGTIESKMHQDDTVNSWALGLMNVTLDGATVNITTENVRGINIFKNISMMNGASMTLEGLCTKVDGVYGRSGDASSITFGDTGNGTNNSSGGRIMTVRHVDVTLNSPNAWAANIYGSSTVTIGANDCAVDTVDGPVTVNANQCNVSSVDNTVELNGSHNTVNGVNDVTFTSGSHNAVSNVNSATSATVGTSDNYISGFNAALTVDGDDNYIEGVEGNITVNGENNVVTKCGEWDSGNFTAAYTIDVAGLANHVMGCTADVTIQSGGGSSYVAGIRGDCTVNPSGCTVVHVTGTFTDNDGGTATLGV